ncbi:MAG TPA: T9SS type A sorting domain-containing protein [Elusimicrobiota bacterium]|nr:T9SS type A sorting domain-containing protein [Elusimicrobiota bacterium]
MEIRKIEGLFISLLLVSFPLVLTAKSSTVYPVPFSPAKGHKNITFSNLPTAATIKILTVDGELVQELRKDDLSSNFQWDVTNKNGEPLASDVYFYVISSDEQKKTGKIVIVR